MPNDKAILGTFSNDGLGMPIEISEEVLREMRKIVSKDNDNIATDFLTQLNRLDEYIKKNIGAIPRKASFVTWFFDKKSMGEWGENLPEITDSELIEFAQKYKDELDALLRKQVSKKDNPAFKVMDMDKLELLSEMVSKKLIEAHNNRDFINIFSDNLSGHKVNWAESDTLLIYFFQELQRENIVVFHSEENEFIRSNFLVKGRECKNLKQTKYNLKNNKNGKPSKYYLIDEIIAKVKKALPD